MEKTTPKVETTSPDNELKRALSATNLTMLGIGAVIGTGIFVLTGTAAANFAGPALVISFIISGIGCAFAGLCYAEFASMIPTAGSAYAYAYETLGRFIAWIIGWDLILEYLFGASTVAVGWSGYAVSLLRDIGINIPAQLTASPGTLVTVSGSPEQITALFNLPAFLIILAVTTLLVVGISESARFNNVIVFVKVAVVLAFIAFGAAYVNMDNCEPFIPPNTGTFGEYGWSGIMRASGVIFFAYIGFDAVSTVAQEAKNPQRDMPIGILASLFVCTVLYILVTLVLTGIVPYKELNVAEPIALGVDRAGSGLLWLRPLIKIGAIAGLSSVMLVMLMGQPRIFYAMAKDNLLPAGFAKVHPRFQTPYVTTILTGVVSATVAGFVPINILGELVSIGTLLAFVIVCVGIIVLRQRRPDLPRPFKTPLVPLVPILGALICFAQMIFLPGDTWLRLIIWMAIGLVIYFTYGRYRTRGKVREAFQ